MQGTRQTYPDDECFSVSLRPAPVRRAITWELRGDRLLKDGVEVADLRSVTSGEFLYERGDATSRSLKLTSDLGETKIRCGSGPEKQKEVEELIVRVLTRVESLSPEASIHVHGGASYLIFFACLMAACALLMLAIAVHGLGLGMGFERLVLSLPLAGLCMWRFWQLRIWDIGRFDKSVAEAIEVVHSCP